MYTGRTEKPCCLCGDPETAHRIDIPPRTIQQLKHAEPIAWRDIEGEVSLYFCQGDWETVRDLVLETGMSPLPRCNAGRASFVLRDDFEALLNANRAEPDQHPLERELRQKAKDALERYEADDPHVEERDLVEARVVTWALDDLGPALASADD
ncbi:hypothetical protein [Natronomonas sp. LN261]|jgi:hypothetical protein|uniref:hypothetical protein n=1 Tax=Natronomonas sp. LN261 TaxID=2750669 RepID=UPI0015EEAE18|nr:hypothetical protein [Natronomonas sp. LN261]